MKLVHISDIHLTIPGERMGGLDPHRRLQLALDDVNEKHADAERIIISGDLTHWGEAEAYQSLKEILSVLSIPVRLMIGNHDDRQEFLKVFSDHPRDDNGYINHAETIDQTRLIYLDTTAPKTHAGHFESDRQAWLEEELKSATRARLFFHHNPMEVGLPALDTIALVAEDRETLRALLQRYQNRIDYIHFGHIHTPVHGTYQGIPFASAPSTGLQSIPDLTNTKWLQSAPMDPAYCVIQVVSADTFIYQVPFLWQGPINSSGTEWDDWAKSE